MLSLSSLFVNAKKSVATKPVRVEDQICNVLMLVYVQTSVVKTVRTLVPHAPMTITKVTVTVTEPTECYPSIYIVFNDNGIV